MKKVKLVSQKFNSTYNRQKEKNMYEYKYVLCKVMEK